MRVLYAGYSLEQREQKDRQKGVKPGERAKLRQFDQKLQDDRQSLTTA